MIKNNSIEFDESIELKDNAMLRQRPELFYEWDFKKNDELGLDVYKVTFGSGKKVWWIGFDCGHRWDAVINNRKNGSGCPYCSGNKILKGFNDMWTTNPELAKLLANSEDGYRHTQNSNLKVDWRCDGCNIIIKGKDVHTTKVQGLYCLNCSDKSSIGERIMHSLLVYLEVSFKHEVSFEWSENKRYDFYLLDFNTIIEVHGEQHYIGGFERKGGDSLEVNIENDKLKKSLANENEIDDYIVIDARKYSYQWIMDSIMDSELKDILNLSEEKLKGFNFDINSSRIKDVWNLWNSGVKNAKNIELTLKISRASVFRYLKLGRDLNIIS